MRLLVATHNPGKIREYRALLALLAVPLSFPADLALEVRVVETGATYAENAALKARAYAQASGLLTLADDSGLEVDALGGAPGIRSARYVLGDDADRVAALLKALADVPWERRTARFRCVIAIALPGGEVRLAEGVCEGVIGFKSAGSGGFGYDPVFYLPEHGCTMAQLSEEEKNKISHRARATQTAIPILRELLHAYSLASPPPSEG